ncbi:MAG: hypothetical protein R3F37_21155 [Candidatus Competibacteraceae bacterium]
MLVVGERVTFCESVKSRLMLLGAVVVDHLITVQHLLMPLLIVRQMPDRSRPTAERRLPNTVAGLQQWATRIISLDS